MYSFESLSKNISPDLGFVEQVLRDAGKLVMSKFGGFQNYQQKEDPSQIVTEVDITSEHLIISEIERLYPTDSIIAEESGFKNKNSEFVWIIDPIDGTSNYASGIPWFGIMVGRAKNWEVESAGIYLPFSDEMYLATKGQGSFKNGKKFTNILEKDLSKKLVSYSLDSNKDTKKTDFEVKIIRKLIPHIKNLRTTNSITDFVYAAEGKLGAAINQNTKIWDIASAILLANEAGCIVYDIEGRPIDLKVDERNYLKNFTIIIANQGLFNEVLKLIKQI